MTAPAPIETKKDVVIIGAPFSGGQGKPGCDAAPKMLEESGLGDEVKKLGWTVEWNRLNFPEPENDPIVNNMKRPRFVSSATEKIYRAVASVAEDNKFPLTIGGDHSIAIGTLSGVVKAHPDACVIWIDAHADINSPRGSLSGNLHGCPVSFVLGQDEQNLSKEDLFSWVPRGCLDPKRIAYVGLRDADDFEKDVIKKYQIPAFSMHDVDRHGIAKVMDMAIQAVSPNLSRPIHLSFDVDALDPFFAPSTGTPVRGGLTWREGCYICEAIAETGKLIGMDLVECNPYLGENEGHVNTTLQSGIALVKSALGQSLL